MDSNSKIDCSNNSDCCFQDETCFEGKTVYCSEIFLKNNAWVCLPKCTKPCIKTKESIAAKIIKRCCGKILIEGTLCKKIKYKAINNTNYTVVIDHPFCSYINVDELSDKDEYRIVGCEVICDYTKHDFKKINCKKECILKDLNVVRIVIERVEKCK